MAFFGRVGSILRQTVSKQIINGEVSASISKPSIYRAIRWFSSIPSSKLFIGGEPCFPFKLWYQYIYFCCFCVKIIVFCVAGISYSTDELQLREAFSKYGQVIDGMIYVLLAFYIVDLGKSYRALKYEK